jgi:hypothetical protein
MNAAITVVVTLAVIAVTTGAYWLPTIIAGRRHTRRLAQIAIVNGLAGWTVAGWIIALAMAFDPATTPTPAAKEETPWVPPARS